MEGRLHAPKNQVLKAKEKFLREINRVTPGNIRVISETAQLLIWRKIEWSGLEDLAPKMEKV